LIPAPAWQLRELQERTGVLQSAPAIHEHEKGQGSVPERMTPDRQGDETSDSKKAKTGRYQQTPASPDDKPEK
jgi:hypothetical protein